jgi:predicted acetyltransferase
LGLFAKDTGRSPLGAKFAGAAIAHDEPAAFQTRRRGAVTLRLMDIALVEAPAGMAPLLGRLMQLYAYDFSEILPLDVDDAGCFPGGTSLATCWREPWRHPYVIRADPSSRGPIVGFAILDERSRLNGDPDVVDVAEFFVLRRYRRRGVGGAAATAAFRLFRRRWEVRQIAANSAATAFWRRTIADFTGGRYAETFVDDSRWRGHVQRFDARSPHAHE